MPRSGTKSAKSSKTARVLSLLTDPAASVTESRGDTDSARSPESGETEVLSNTGAAPGAPGAPGTDDAATENQIRDALVEELFGGKKAAPPRSRRAARKEVEAAYTLPPPDEEVEAVPPPAMEAPAPAPATPTASANAMDAAPAPSVTQAAPPAGEPSAPPPVDLSMFSNPSTLGNSSPLLELDPVPPALRNDVARELVAGMPGQPEPKPMETPAPAPFPQAAPSAQAVTPSAAPSQAEEDEENPDDFICFNLTQALVEDKADKYMELFGMCTCNRCKVDVTAIALSNLPAKYVATQNRDVLPLLSMYEEKYSAAVTVQVMAACKLVMNRPHHKR